MSSVLAREGFSVSTEDSGSALFRLSRFSINNSHEFNAAQTQVDGAVTHALEEAANTSTLGALLTGTGAARLARTGILALGANATGWAARGVQAAATVGSLGAEVVGFEAMNRFMIGLISPIRPMNSWRWSGPGGWREGLFSSGITFTALRGAGRAAQGQNIVFQHTAQSSAMVAGHNIAGALRIIPAPEGSFTQQFFDAEITNIQLAAMISTFHTVAPGFHAFERSLELTNQSRSVRTTHESPLQEGWNPFDPQLATAGSRGRPALRPEAESPIRDPRKNPHLLLSENQGEGGSGGGGNKPPERVLKGTILSPPDPRAVQPGKPSSTDILRESLEIGLGDFINILPHGVGIFKMDQGLEWGRIIMVNARLEAMFDYHLHEVVGLNLLDFIHPEDAPPIREGLSNFPPTGRISLREIRLRRSDGSFFWADVRGGIGNFNNKRVGFLFVEDVGGRMQAHEDRIAAERSSAALEAVKVMSGGVAQDLNNYLSIVRGALSGIERGLKNILGRNDIPPDLIPTLETLQRMSGRADEGVSRIGNLTAEFRELNAPPEQGPPFNLNLLLRANEIQIREILGPEIETVIDPEIQECWVPGPGARIDRVIANLVGNAKDALQDREIRRLTLQTRNMELGANDLAAFQLNPSEWEAKPGPYVRLRIQDTGMGMDEATRAQIFEPYFSTKRKSHTGHGGLGLAITRKIVQDAGGFITVESTPGVGTVFDVYLPQGSHAGSTPSSQPPASPSASFSRPGNAPNALSAPLTPPMGAVTQERIATRILDEHPFMILLTDPDHKIVYANGEARRALGADLYGRSLQDFLSSEAGVEGTRYRLRTEEGRDVLWEDRPHPFIRRLTAHYLLDVTGRAQTERLLEELKIKAGEGHLAVEVIHDARSTLSPAVMLMDRLTRMVRDRLGEDEIPPGSDPLASPLSLIEQTRDSLNLTMDIFNTGMNILRGGVAELSLDQVLVEAIHSNQIIRESRNIELNIQMSPGLGIFGNKRGLREVLGNLLMNACEAMPEGGQITVRAYAENRMAVIEITDTGMGIPAESLGRIFTPYFTTKEQGTGIGLATVKKIIEQQHGGTIEVESEEGRGSTFRIRLPLFPSSHPPAEEGHE